MGIIRRLATPALATLTALAIAGCSDSSDAPAAKPPVATTSATPKATIELTDATFVMNPDGSATLSATIVNHTQKAQLITGYTVKQDGAAVRARDFHFLEYSELGGGKSVTMGTLHSAQIQADDNVAVGQSLAVEFVVREFYHRAEPVVLRADVPVVERTAEHEAVVGAKVNPDIKVEDGKVVVIPGQKRAYIGGTVVSRINDGAGELPTAVDADGNVVKYRHQTATGGPYGVVAVKGRRMALGGPPFMAVQGDADYINAKDVKVGEKLTVTIPFESGNVEAVFTVVAG